MQILIKTFAITFVIVTAVAWAAFGQLIGISVAVGFVTMATNTWLTRRTVRQFTSGGRTTLVGLYVLKMALLFGLLYVFLKVLELNVVGLVVGLSIPMMVMIFAGNSWMAAEDASEGDDGVAPVENGV